MHELWQFEKDRIKRLIRPVVLRVIHQEPPIETLFRILEIEGFACQGLRGLEVFGMHGLWVVKDYLRRCDTLDLWEINPKYARFACRLGPSVKIICGDSVKAICTHDPRIGRYDLIHIDSPQIPFGPGYCEHFDLFPHVLSHLHSTRGGLLVINFLGNTRSDIEPHSIMTHARRRREFYGTESLTPRTAIAAYQRYAEGVGLDIVYHCVIPKNSLVYNIGMVLKPRSTQRN